VGGLALALASAVTFGTADFLGGLATRRASALLVTLSAHLTGAVVVVPALFLLRAPLDPASLAWGAASRRVRLRRGGRRAGIAIHIVTADSPRSSSSWRAITSGAPKSRTARSSASAGSARARGGRPRRPPGAR
jgi:hypothetical protein